MSDEEFYLQATKEVEEDSTAPALWAKAVALVEGDTSKAKYQYIKLRVGQLENAELENTAARANVNSQENKVNTPDHAKPEEKKTNQLVQQDMEVGFVWWQVWAWLGLTIGNIYVGVSLFQEMAGFAVFLVITNTVLMVLVLNFNKYAFLVATILSLNPLVWIINGIYLKNRWNHPKVNEHQRSEPVGIHKQMSSDVTNTAEDEMYAQAEQKRHDAKVQAEAETRSRADRDAVNRRYLLKLCAHLRGECLSYHQYQQLAQGTGASLGLHTGLMSTRYVVSVAKNQIVFKRVKDLRPWFIENIVPLIEDGA